LLHSNHNPQIQGSVGPGSRRLPSAVERHATGRGARYRSSTPLVCPASGFSVYPDFGQMQARCAATKDRFTGTEKESTLGP
jgi:hypothetical protein